MVTVDNAPRDLALKQPEGPNPKRPSVSPPRLTIERTSPADEQSRQIICALDGKRIGQLLYGQSMSVEVAPGPHTLRIHNTLVWKTVRFEAEPGDEVRYSVWNKRLGGYYLAFIFLGAAPLGLGVERRPGASTSAKAASIVATDSSPRAGRP
jgi:hypothetical protein